MATPSTSFGTFSIGSKVKAAPAAADREFLFFKSEKVGFGQRSSEPKGS